MTAPVPRARAAAASVLATVRLDAYSYPMVCEGDVHVEVPHHTPVPRLPSPWDLQNLRTACGRVWNICTSCLSEVLPQRWWSHGCSSVWSRWGARVVRQVVCWLTLWLLRTLCYMRLPVG